MQHVERVVPVAKDGCLLLGKLKVRGAVRGLIDLLDDERGGVAANAHWALSQITGLKIGPDAERWAMWWRLEGSKTGVWTIGSSCRLRLATGHAALPIFGVAGALPRLSQSLFRASDAWCVPRSTLVFASMESTAAEALSTKHSCIALGCFGESISS